MDVAMQFGTPGATVAVYDTLNRATIAIYLMTAVKVLSIFMADDEDELHARHRPPLGVRLAVELSKCISADKGGGARARMTDDAHTLKQE